MCVCVCSCMSGSMIRFLRRLSSSVFCLVIALLCVYSTALSADHSCHSFIYSFIYSLVDYSLCGCAAANDHSLVWRLQDFLSVTIYFSYRYSSPLNRCRLLSGEILFALCTILHCLIICVIQLLTPNSLGGT